MTFPTTYTQPNSLILDDTICERTFFAPLLTIKLTTSTPSTSPIYQERPWTTTIHHQSRQQSRGGQYPIRNPGCMWPCFNLKSRKTPAISAELASPSEPNSGSSAHSGFVSMKNNCAAPVWITGNISIGKSSITGRNFPNAWSVKKSGSLPNSEKLPITNAIFNQMIACCSVANRPDYPQAFTHSSEIRLFRFPCGPKPVA